MKGVIYAIYLSPTYINIFTIYAISNIHDVSWGSRPTTQSAIFQAVEKKKLLVYKDYRSKFLIFWVVVNIIVAAGFLYLWREDQVDVIFYIGAFLVFTMFFRIILSILHKCKSRCDKIRTNFTVMRRKSTVFKDVGDFKVKDKREVFAVYYEEGDQDIRFSKKTDPKFIASQIRSSVKDQSIYRGFNLPEITYKQKLSQGYFEGRVSRTSGIKIPRQSSARYVNESIDESDEEFSSSVDDPNELPHSHIDRGHSHVIGNKKPSKPKKVNFASNVKDR